MVVPEGASAPPVRADPARGRPTWWVVLAVSLALLALVAATAARTAGSARPPPAHPSATRTVTTNGTKVSATTTLSTTTTRVAAPTTAPADPTGSAHPTQGVSALVGTPTTTRPPVAATTTTTTTPAGSSYAGTLQPPADGSANFHFTGDGSTRVTASWSDSTYLTLTVTCSGFDQSTGGSSAAALNVPDAQGGCLAVLNDPSATSDTISYMISADPDD